MKRWSMDAYCMLEDPDGEWVRADIAEEMVKLLKEIEWLEEWDEYIDGPIYGCPVCENLNTKGHHESCELGKLIAKIDSKENRNEQ